ncbi:hypothetical protein DEF23_15360 [Marinitenerispora sediminis]|nr:hypothetical protein DEF23_15360 [Marinitenerispora sediminis]
MDGRGYGVSGRRVLLGGHPDADRAAASARPGVPAIRGPSTRPRRPRTVGIAAGPDHGPPRSRHAGAPTERA